MTFDSKWDEIHSKVDWHTEPDHYFSEFFVRNYRVGGGKFLDLGCGTGASTIMLARLGFNVVAVDASLNAITKLVQNLHASGFMGMIEAKHCDIASLEFEDHSFDGIVDVCTLQHLPFDNVVKIVKKAKKWLKPEGRFFSKMACEPYDKRASRTEINLIDGLDAVAYFFGYLGTVEQQTDYVADGKYKISHYIFDMGNSVGSRNQFGPKDERVA